MPKDHSEMASLDLPLTLLGIIFTLALISLQKSRRSSAVKRPPGPPGWPLVGNMFDVGSMPHQNMHKLKLRYGPVLWLRIGTQNTVVVQSAAAAAELFKKHDLPFSDRKVPDSLTACGYNRGSLANARYGDYWRMMRRLCRMEFTTHKRINDSSELRQKCVDNMIYWIEDDASKSESGEIQLDHYLSLMSFNLVSSFMLSRDIMDMKSDAGNEFFETMNKFMEWNGQPNFVDVFGFLKWIDPQGIRRNTAKHLGRLLDLAARFVKERIQEKNRNQNKTRDFLDAMLEYTGEGSDYLTEKNITIMVMEMFFGGTETTGSTIQWAMAELLKNPNFLTKLKTELNQVIGKSRSVEEKDLPNLPYLQAIIKEVMRLHPSLPLLMPRNSMEDTEFMGYTIPKNTLVLLNAWSIHRDPDSWQDPYYFNPDRFLNSNIDHKGQNFELIPFGSGRRSCIGMLLGDRMVSLTVARLVQAFDWELPLGVSPESLDMRELVGIAVRKLIPLKAIPRKRESN